jgi:hypothetical protein
MWPRRKADRLLEEMIRENKLAAEAASASRPPRFSSFRRKRKPVPFTARPTAKSRGRRSDLTVAALGVTLGLICALFPWYIFFNPEEFGVRSMKFGGNTGGTEPIILGAQPERVGAPVAVQEIPPTKLDLLATGTATKEYEEEDEKGTPDLTEQPSWCSQARCCPTAPASRRSKSATAARCCSPTPARCSKSPNKFLARPAQD